jgi:hypothetical protein
MYAKQTLPASIRSAGKQFEGFFALSLRHRHSRVGGKPVLVQGRSDITLHTSGFCADSCEHRLRELGFIFLGLAHRLKDYEHYSFFAS